MVQPPEGSHLGYRQTVNMKGTTLSLRLFCFTTNIVFMKYVNISPPWYCGNQSAPQQCNDIFVVNTWLTKPSFSLKFLPQEEGKQEGFIWKFLYSWRKAQLKEVQSWSHIAAQDCLSSENIQKRAVQKPVLVIMNVRISTKQSNKM